MIRSSDLEGWKCFISSQPGDIHYDFSLHSFLEKKNKQTKNSVWNLVGERQLWSQTIRRGGAFSRPQETWRQKDMIYYIRHLFISILNNYMINFVEDQMRYEDE